MANPWTCYARPASTGRTCFHENTAGYLVSRVDYTLLCCESCGATKHAGDLRRARGDIDGKKGSRRD